MINECGPSLLKICQLSKKRVFKTELGGVEFSLQWISWIRDDVDNYYKVQIAILHLKRRADFFRKL